MFVYTATCTRLDVDTRHDDVC